MRIGIDFDNTVVNYDEVFKKVALQLSLIKKDWNGTKQELRKKIIREKNEEVWKKLQGLVYGKYMHLAKISDGFINFFVKAKLLGAKLYIISHKTIHGHYDKDKVLLRKEALKWINKKKILDFDNIYFESSIENKIKRINSLKLDYFIDDLFLILNNKNFSRKVKKILFNKIENKKFSQNIKQIDEWFKVKDFIFGYESIKQMKIFAEHISKKKVKKIKKIKGQRNSQIYKIIYKNGLTAALKKYPDVTSDNRERMNREYSGLKLIQRNGFRYVSKVLYADPNLNIIILKWINGQKPNKISNLDLIESVNFIKTIHKISKKNTKNFPYDAVESCKSLKEITDQIDYKLLKLLKVKNNSRKFRNFLRFTIMRTYKKLNNNIKTLKLLKLFSKPIPKKYEILSPSDFGFHNSLKNSGKIFFIDFEYFGKDDPVKLVSDFLLHPGMSLTNTQKRIWLKKVSKIFLYDKEFVNRLRFFIPFYAIRWSLIVLNDFRVSNIYDHCQNIRVNKKFFLKKRKEQVRKALYFSNLVKNNYYQKWLS